MSPTADSPQHATDPIGVASHARYPKLARFLADHAIRFGDFELTSSSKASFYCDVKQASFSPQGAGLIVEAALAELDSLDIDVVGGMDMGATPIVSAVALRSGQLGRPLPSFVVRKVAKGHGMQRQVEGLLSEQPCRVAVIDDVVTSGGSIIKAIDVIRELGHDLVVAISVFDREAGGAEKISAMGIEYRPLVRLSELVMPH